MHQLTSPAPSDGKAANSLVNLGTHDAGLTLVNLGTYDASNTLMYPGTYDAGDTPANLGVFDAGYILVHPETYDAECGVAARAARPLTDAHHLPPAGVISHSAAAGASGRVYRIPGTSFALGSRSAASTEARDYDAVLDCGLQGRPAPAASRKLQPSSTRAHQDPAAGPVPDSHSCSAEPASEHTPSSGGASQPPAYLWLPIKSSKVDRQGLQRALPEALAFLEGHRRAARTVLVCDDDGCDSCVCAVVAALACQGKVPCTEELSYEQLSARMAAVKASVRKHLAEVSRGYPLARPTRGSLKQTSRVCCEYV